VIGDFSLLGLPNIDSTNVADIIGGPERYGGFVIFDEDLAAASYSCKAKLPGYTATAMRILLE